jgi:quercetin dioxygenase-like cupin family protein
MNSSSVNSEKIAPAKSEEDVNEELQGVQSNGGDIILFDMRKLTHFRAEGPFVQVLSDIGVARVVLFAFKAGQQLKEHRTSSQILVQALRGRITFTTAGDSVKMQAGMILQVEASVPHSVLAQTDAVMLLTMLPSPSQHAGSEHEELQGLTPLVRRISDSEHV